MKWILASERGRLASADHAERGRLAFRLRSVFQGSLYRPLTLSTRYLALTLSLASPKVACLDETPAPVFDGQAQQVDRP